MSPNEPIDWTHAYQIASVAWIRDAVDRLRAQVEVWEPRPLPKKKR